jgi:hypothetical protein
MGDVAQYDGIDQQTATRLLGSTIYILLAICEKTWPEMTLTDRL